MQDCVVPPAGAAVTVHRINQLRHQLPVECTWGQLGTVSPWRVNAVQSGRDIATVFAIAQERPQMRNDVLQRLTGNLPALEPDVILDVGSAQCPQRSIG